MEEEKEAKMRRPLKKTKLPRSSKRERYANIEQVDQTPRINPRAVARERSIHRYLSAANILDDEDDAAAAEVNYDANFNFFRDGIQIESFNTKDEMKRGYLDWKGDFVAYALGDDNDKEKDPWLQWLYEDDGSFTSKYYRNRSYTCDDDRTMIEDVAKISRRIAKVLGAEETVSQALRRLKRGRSDKKGRMTEEAMELFHQLTDDATNLVQHYGGGCNVYQLKKAKFLEEAKRYDPSTGYWAMVCINWLLGNSLETGELLHSDYVFDPSTGYYYHGSSGYYYDPSSGMYCYAGTGQWFAC